MDLNGFLYRLSAVAWRTEWLFRRGQIRAAGGNCDPITFLANATFNTSGYRAVGFLDAAAALKLDQRLALAIGQASDQPNPDDPLLSVIRDQLIAILNPAEAGGFVTI